MSVQAELASIGRIRSTVGFYRPRGLKSTGLARKVEHAPPCEGQHQPGDEHQQRYPRENTRVNQGFPRLIVLDQRVQVADGSPGRAELSRRPVRGKGVVHIDNKARPGEVPEDCLG